MRPAHQLERTIGIEYYVSDTDGTGGRLRETPADFRVTELEGIDPEPLAADPAVYDHLVLRVTLSSWETHEFASELSDRLGISRKRVSWAGTKDKHAETTQLFSVQNLKNPAIPEIPDATIEPIGRLGRRITLGDLIGNKFRITIQAPDTPANTTSITRELQQFCGTEDSVCVPNYFGHQRFGTTRPITHEVGFRILEDDWQAAVMTYIGNPVPSEAPDTRAAREFVEETEDWHAAIDKFPQRLRYERAILHRLAETDPQTPDEYRAGLEALPVNLQRLFVHAAQSYLFNRLLSRRLDCGLPFDRAVAGDVVCFTDEYNDLRVPDTDRLHRVTADSETVNRHVSRGRAVVTAPLIGTDTEFGDNTPGALAREVLDSAGLTRADFDLPGEFRSRGTRRAILVQTPMTQTNDPLQLSFVLPKGSYATIVLREYLKTSPEAL